MPWYVPVVVRMLAAYVAGPLLLKPIVAQYTQAKLLLLQFAVCFAVALPLAVALHQHRFEWTIVAVGCGNGLAAYCYRKAIALSLSRTALFAFWDDLLAMGLSYALLHEGQFLNTRMLLGIGLSVGAVILFTIHGAPPEPPSQEAPARVPRRLYLYAGAYSVMLGFGVFFMRYLGVKDTGLGTVLVNWYGGVLVAALGLSLLVPDEAKDPTALPAVPWRDRLRILGLSLVVLTAMSAAYTAYRLAPQTVVQPLFLVGEMIAPALIGLYVFAERAALDRYEQGLFVAGRAGRVGRRVGRHRIRHRPPWSNGVTRTGPSPIGRRIFGGGGCWTRRARRWARSRTSSSPPRSGRSAGFRSRLEASSAWGRRRSCSRWRRSRGPAWMCRCLTRGEALRVPFPNTGTMCTCSTRHWIQTTP